MKSEYKKINKSAIKRDGQAVVVIDNEGKEVFRQPATEQYIQIAHCLYMYHKYGIQ